MTKVEPPPGTDAAFRGLYGLRQVDDLGLAVYVAGGLRRARHVMRLDRDDEQATFRTLVRGEPAAWAAGLAAGAGHPDLAFRIAEARVPPLVTLDQAATKLGLTVSGVAYLINRGMLLPLYGNNARGQSQQRFLYSAQVEAERLARELVRDDLKPARRRQLEERHDLAAELWLQVRQTLPTPLPREALTGVDLQPLPSPDPLPLGRPPRAAAGPVHIRGLQIAEQQGWLTYHHPVDGGYAVTIGRPRSRHRATVTIPVGWLLPWLLGLADHKGRADLVAYRPGLGG